MNGVVSYDDIGRVAFAYYKADIERFNAKHQRAAARASHPCEGEHDIGDGHVEPYPCWRSPVVMDWCDNCKYVQPFYTEYMMAVIEARKAKNKLTRFCKRMLWNEGN